MIIQTQINLINTEVADQSALLDKAIAALQGKAAGGGLPEGISDIKTGTVTPTSDATSLSVPDVADTQIKAIVVYARDITQTYDLTKVVTAGVQIHQMDDSGTIVRIDKALGYINSNGAYATFGAQSTNVSEAQLKKIVLPNTSASFKIGVTYQYIALF